MSAARARRALVIDDTRAIHEDYRKILMPVDCAPPGLAALADGIFGAPDAPAELVQRWELDFAAQGEEGLALCRAAVAEGAPYRLAFVDMRMPPGWDGVRTIQELWRVDPKLEVVLCSAYCDRSHDEIVRELGDTDRLIVLKKPFDSIEIIQLARSLGAKWELEREREARIGALSCEVEARTRELEARIADLARSNKRLEEAMIATACASRARDEFLTNVTHELRTPLTAILGFAELIEDAHPGGEIDNHLHTIRSNGEHLLALINDLLDLSRLEAGAMPVERVPCDPRTLVEEVGQLLAPRALQKGLSLSLRCSDGLPARVASDPTRLRQILLNLAGNAIKFTEHGTVEVMATCPRSGVLEFRVRDTGIGLTEEQQSRLFLPFAQADASMARRFGGTGLGLSITRKLVELLGGNIELESQLGAGSTFRVELPADELAPEPRAALPSAQPETAISTGPLHGARVLVVDDARDVQRLVRTFLERAGAVVAGSAGDGVEGLARALELRGELDLLLLDMMMPRLDGYEVVRRLRAEQFDLPVVALTAHAQHGDDQRCLDAGCDAFVPKPIDRAQFLKTCEDLIEARRASKRAHRSG